MGCVQDVVGNKKFVFQFEYGQERDTSASLISYVCEKQEVVKKLDETIYDPPKMGYGEQLTIDGDTVCEGERKFGKGIYLSIFYFLCFVEEISVDIAQKQVMEETDPDLNWEEYVMIFNDMEEHWKEVEQEDNEYRGKVFALRLEVQTKQKKYLIKSEFLVVVLHTEGGGGGCLDLFEVSQH